MKTLELKQKIIDKLKSVDDLHLLQQVLNLLQPIDPNEIKHLNENEMEMAKEIEEEDGIIFGIDVNHKQPDEDDSDWITEL